MFSTCIFCQRDLGVNEVIEAFPVGRRLAFDPDKGRLWVVCRACGRWNLSPLEERWEAIEECERRFHGTRLRVATEHIGLARLLEGLELVRVGPAQRSELAAWRYGDQFGRRRRRNLLVTGGAVAGLVALYVGGPATGLIAGGTVGVANTLVNSFNIYRAHRILARVPTPDGARLELARGHIMRSRLVPDAEAPGGFRLRLPFRPRPTRPRGLRARVTLGLLRARSMNSASAPQTDLTGDAALHAAGLLLPHLNPYGGSRSGVLEGVRFLEDAGSPERVFARAAAARRRMLGNPGGEHTLRGLPTPIRLALEMASHEETERRALEGELDALEAAWREAEEIAAIADDLLLPPAVESFVRTHRREPPAS